ncbi:unnamed protein product [Dicrocoelium dendriticum]|nr:unnamed protein product [Dicrocoelium dendriticum]
MENVSAFNVELNSLRETPLPVSRKKMASITRAAFKALKFYKHVVQSVEKFIIRCPPELKVPGLYVIDAIVRQSQSFYHEKDVYGPRFMRNIVTVFLSITQCDEKDKPMVQRVLHLWQRGTVFPNQVIQALQNVFNDPENPSVVKDACSVIDAVNRTVASSKILTSGELGQVAQTKDHTSLSSELHDGKSSKEDPLHLRERPLSTSEAQLLQLQMMQQKIAEQSSLLNQARMIDPEVRSQLQTLMAQLNQRREEAMAQLAEGKTEDEVSLRYILTSTLNAYHCQLQP